MPGGIDTHVHFELPFMGTVSADDFFTGTSAALSGGTTMIFDFAIPAKNQSLIDIYNEYRKKADSKVTSDYGLHLSVTKFTENTAKEMEEVSKKGINSFKMFLAYKNVFQIEDYEFMKVMEICTKLKCIPMVHAENGDAVIYGQEKMKKLGIMGPEGHPLSRPASVEGEATKRAALFAEITGSPLYVVHVMSKDSMDEISNAQSRGVKIVGEPVLSGLSLDESGYWKKNWDEASRYVMSPPIRSIEHQRAIRNGLKSGLLSTIGTDHCTFTTEQKRMGKDDFTKIPNGVNGVEDRMNIIWSDLVYTGELSPNEYVRATSTQAAKIFNIYPQKGAIFVGSDADIIILDPKATKTISAKTHHQNIDYNVYEGKKINGVVDTTISRGVIVWEDGKLTVVKGAGRFVPTPLGGSLFN